jgi:hypothetical protein
VQAWPEIIKAAKQGKSKYQIGNGSNLTDYTYEHNQRKRKEKKR